MLIAGNWKMFKGPAEARAFADAFEPPDGVDVVVCPAYPALSAAVVLCLLVSGVAIGFFQVGPPGVDVDE